MCLDKKAKLFKSQPLDDILCGQDKMNLHNISEGRLPTYKSQILLHWTSTQPKLGSLASLTVADHV